MRPSGEQQARKKPYHLLPVTLVHVTFSRHLKPLSVIFEVVRHESKDSG